ncbi:MAG: hypothetical protein ACREH3_18485, partial [Geminicoccales bacterium]
MQHAGDVPAQAVVLIVERDGKSRTEIEEHLIAAGFISLTGVADMSAAVEACATTAPDVILLQASLAEGDRQALERLRAAHPD